MFGALLIAFMNENYCLGTSSSPLFEYEHHAVLGESDWSDWIEVEEPFPVDGTTCNQMQVRIIIFKSILVS